MSGDFYVGTTWPPLLSGWKSLFAENLKVVNADKCSPSLAVSTCYRQVLPEHEFLYMK